MSSKKCKLQVVRGVEGPSLSIGDGETGTRIAGPKPWGGGKIIHSFDVDPVELVRLAAELVTELSEDD